MNKHDNPFHTVPLPSVAAGIAIFIAAIILCASLCSAAFTGSNSGLGAFGAIFFNAYGWSSFFIPFHLIAAALIAVFPGWKLKNGLLVLFSVFPFFSAVAAERILAIQDAYSFTRILGTPGICFLAFIIIAIEYTAAWFAATAAAGKLEFISVPALQKHFSDIKKPAAETDEAAEIARIFAEPKPPAPTAVPPIPEPSPAPQDSAGVPDTEKPGTAETDAVTVPAAAIPQAPILKSREVFNRIFEEHAAMEMRFGDFIQEEIQEMSGAGDGPEEYTDPTSFDDDELQPETGGDTVETETETGDETADSEQPDEAPLLRSATEETAASAVFSNAIEPEPDTEPAIPPAPQDSVRKPTGEPQAAAAPVLHIGVNEHRPLAEYEAILEGRPFQQTREDESETDIFDEPFSVAGDEQDADEENDMTDDVIDSDDTRIGDFDLYPDAEDDREDFPAEDSAMSFTGTAPDSDEDDDIFDIEPEIESDGIISADDIPEPVIDRQPAKPEPPAATPVYKKGRKYEIPAADLLTAYPDGQYWVIDDDTREAAAILKETLNEFKIDAEVTGIRKGPVITMFEILPAPGVKLQKIAALQDNIALRLAASSIRIIAPIPGKHAVGIEVPNKERAIVSFREMIESEPEAALKMAVPVVLGKDITGGSQYLDLATTPHLLIAGSTGAGKSVCVNSMILSILYKRSPEEVRMILIDPKIVELKLYNDIPHLLTPVITEPKRAYQALQYCLCEMERRYAMLDGMGVRDIKSYNRRIKERGIATEKLPYIIVIIDEFADLMATTGKELESTIARLAAMSRAVGIHLVLATQRPSIDVITGLIKANIPSRIAFMVASKMDSRIIIDQVGAEKLLGKGDMLYSSATSPFPSRIQGAFVTDNEVEKVAEYVRRYGEPDYIDDEIFYDEDEDDGTVSLFAAEGEDPLYDKALEIVMQAGKASASYIQRRLKIGYNRAARLVEEMELRGIVGPANGSKPRDVLHPM